MALKIGSTTVVDNSANWAGNNISTSAIIDSAITRAKMGFSANYAIASTGAPITVSTGTPTTIASLTITTNGRPVMLIGCIDMNTDTTGWHWMALYRGETQLNLHKTEWAVGGANRPQNISFRDHPSAGTYTYTMRAFQGAGTMTYSEVGGEAGGAAFVALETL